MLIKMHRLTTLYKYRT